MQLFDIANRIATRYLAPGTIVECVDHRNIFSRIPKGTYTILSQHIDTVRLTEELGHKFATRFKIISEPKNEI